jgi:hypothetical protein
VPSDGYRYLADELHGHVRHLRSVCDDLGGVASQDLGAAPNAFGIIGSFIPSMLQPMVDQARSLAAATRDSVDTNAADMRDTVETYETTEHDNAASFRTWEQ